MRGVALSSFALCTLLAGCAQPWQQAGATSQDFYRDNSSCMASAGQPAQIAQANGSFAQGYNQGAAIAANNARAAIYEQCMLGRGWRHGSY